ncbi:hypothetical protein PtA15_17A345 [Puccinia triticina]|uniref:Uncharacterized protein n=1 Tax=Puccinia triticina TaxID=208348 RepID=A0ABY7D8F3_9BASI|nr:uncharacterized protein PtA15_17A345 [Puccinia triticina]WAQ92863.1 hypothetical protein PtA15_17A345 [Puccinia triticina]
MNYGRHAFGSLLPLSERHVLGQASATRCSRPIADLPGIAVLLINSTIPVDTHLSINPGEPKVYTSLAKPVVPRKPDEMTIIPEEIVPPVTLYLRQVLPR